ncbi:hercynine oxygenase [Microcystis aeruginosa NIES-4325]|uniref:Hercynine oxygenase n=1 Tax=Microcystis aeruginosa NIES-4325 TaxID=2569534 RepID=A0A5J4F8J0_MICAE|nr:formylglycine-generating enzyme family protein [Microcystis aeruginosa]GEA26974.1 hercynine oxygenase [Microcystis aeruginosa NIES-4325]
MTISQAEIQQFYEETFLVQLRETSLVDWEDDSDICVGYLVLGSLDYNPDTDEMDKLDEVKIKSLPTNIPNSILESFNYHCQVSQTRLVDIYVLQVPIGDEDTFAIFVNGYVDDSWDQDTQFLEVYNCQGILIGSIFAARRIEPGEEVIWEDRTFTIDDYDFSYEEIQIWSEEDIEYVGLELEQIPLELTQQQLETRGEKPADYQEILGEGIILEMVGIPSGSFLMGISEEQRTDKNLFDKEKMPQHLVTISRPFYIGKYPVTQEQYQTIMGYNPSYFKGEGNLPVGMITWSEALEFCVKLNQLTSKKYRLPSEAEWEYACRAGTTTCYHFGDDISQLEKYAWTVYGSHPVGEKLSNYWGLYDLYGNGSEWCLDVWHGNYKKAPNDSQVWDKGKESLYQDIVANFLQLSQDYRHHVKRGSTSVNRFGGEARVREREQGFRVVCEG